MMAKRIARSPSFLWLAKCLAVQELAFPFRAGELSVLYEDATAQEDCIGNALDVHALVGGVVDALVLVGGADGERAVGIEDHEVGVAAGGDGALAREEAEEFGGHGRDKVDEVRERELARAHTLVEQHDAMLDAGDAVGNLREVVAAKLFLSFIVEGGMVGGDDGEFAALQAEPERLVIGTTAHGRSADKFSSFEAGRGIATIVEVEILRAGLAPDWQALDARGGDGL